eukprot:1172097-Pleurochrysis_carterae.AAC.2
MACTRIKARQHLKLLKLRDSFFVHFATDAVWALLHPTGTSAHAYIEFAMTSSFLYSVVRADLVCLRSDLSVGKASPTVPHQLRRQILCGRGLKL